MEQTLFYNSFSFLTVNLKSPRHTDNSKGIPTHYVARMKSGSGIIRSVSGSELHLSAGDVFYLPRGLKYHSYWSVDEKTGSVSWESYGFAHFPIQSDLSYVMQKINPSKKALSWLDMLNQDQTVSLATVGYLYLFLSEVIPNFRIAGNDPKEMILQKAFDYIKQHESFSVPNLARACGISESGVYALFRYQANTTPIEIKHRLIAERAVVMLATTDLAVETIALTLGLCSSAYLRRILKKQTGKTPSQIRKEVRTI